MLRIAPVARQFAGDEGHSLQLLCHIGSLRVRVGLSLDAQNWEIGTQEHLDVFSF